MATRTKLYGIKKTADILGISPGLLLKELDRGVIQAHRRGHLIKFKPHEIERYEVLQTINNYQPFMDGEGEGFIKKVPV